MTQETLSSDIPHNIANAAHMGTSFVPEKRGTQEIVEFETILKSDWEWLSQFADTPEKQETLKVEFSRYRAGLREKKIASLQAKAQCVSTMIAGPSNFPVARQQKKSDTADRRSQEMISFRDRALKAIKKKLCPELAPIMSGDDDAIERLKEKIGKAENFHSIVKEANKIVRSKPRNRPTDEKIKKLAELLKSEGRAKELFEPDFAGRVGFADYVLKNNNANLRRMKERLAGLESDKSAPEATAEGNGIRLEDSPADNRIRLFFPGKPSVEIRSKLKSNGFRWARSLGCWQAYRNNNSIQVARSFVE